MAAAGVSVLLACVTGLSANPGDPGRGTEISTSAAINVVRGSAHLDGGPLDIQGIRTTQSSRAYQISGPNVEAAVDVRTGKIGLLTLLDHVPVSADIAVSPAVALASAAGIAADNAIGQPAVAPQVELVDHGSIAEYRVSWILRVNRVAVPDQLVVRVNPSTGQWFSVIRIDRPYALPPDPALDMAAARSAAMRSLGPDVVLVGGELVLAFKPDGTQRLVWSLAFIDGDPQGEHVGRSVMIDAMTGEQIDQVVP